MKSLQDLLKFGIINIDKPSGPTSFTISSMVRAMLKVNKTSHFGTLDPQVSGVLPIALGRACKLADWFMHRDKTYVGIMRLHEPRDIKLIEQEVKKFIGKIMQLPPVRSRVKRAIREREIKSFNILESDGQDFLFETTVQAGTYIRKLIHDLGLELGGAHMLELRRTEAGLFKEPAYTMYDLESAIQKYKSGDESQLKEMIQPADELIQKLIPIVKMSKVHRKTLLTGKPIMKNDLAKVPEEDFAVFIDSEFIGIYSPTEEKEILARPQFVFN